MDNIIIGERAWLDIYTSPDPRSDESWIKCKLSNGEDLYSCLSDKITNIKKYCIENNTHIVNAGLQFRSNVLKQNTKDAEAVYLIKSVKGQMGGSTIYCVVIGVLENGIVKKNAYCTPELVKIYDAEDKVEDCFEEMLIYNDQKAYKEE